MSPLVWDLAHIAAYEDLWLCHRHAGEPLLHPDLAATYDAFETPRAVRGEIELLDARRRARGYLARRARARARGAARHGVDPVLHELVLRHELQHTETMRQAMDLGGLLPPGEPPLRALGRRATAGVVAVPAGAFALGAPAPTASPTTTSARATASTLAAFRIARRPVTNALVAALRRGRRLRAPRVVVRRGLGVEGGVRHRRTVAGAAGRGTRDAPGRPRHLVRGRRLRPRARRAPPHRGRVGEGGDLGPAGRREGLRGAGRVWEWTASRVHRLPGLRRPPLPRVLRGLLRRRLPRPARRLVGDAPARRHRRRSATGTCPQRRQIFAGVRLARDEEA